MIIVTFYETFAQLYDWARAAPASDAPKVCIRIMNIDKGYAQYIYRCMCVSS